MKARFDRVTAEWQMKHGPLKYAEGLPSVYTMDLDVSLPAVISFSPSPVAPGANLTITGAEVAGKQD